MNKIFIVCLISLFLLPVITSAQTEITESKYVYPILTIFGTPISGYNVHSPKVACSTYNDICLLAYYDDGYLGTGTGIHLVYSIDNFNTFTEFNITPINYTALLGYSEFDALNGRWKNTSLPFDVMWNQKENTFYFMYRQGFNSFVYKWFDTTPPYTFTQNKTIDSYSQNCFYSFLSFLNDTTLGYVGVANTGVIAIGKYDIPTNTFSQYATHTTSTNAPQGCDYVPNPFLVGSGCFFNYGGVNNIRGDMFMNDDGDLFAHFLVKDFSVNNGTGLGDIQIDTVGWTDFDCSGNGALATDVANHTRGALYYKDNNIFYVSRDNATLGISEGIWNLPATDFTVFGSPSIYYNFTGNPLKIFRSDYSRTSEIDFYMFENETGAVYASTLPSIRAGNTTNQLFQVRVNYVDLDNNTQSDATPNINISCRDSPFSTTSTTNYDTFAIPCDNITLSISATLKPAYITTDIDLVSDFSINVFAGNFSNTLNPRIFIRDQYTREPLSGITVNVDSVPYTTDAQGFATLTINPISTTNNSVKYVGFGTNILNWETGSVFRQSSVTINETGYFGYSDIISYGEFQNTVSGTETFQSPLHYDPIIIDIEPIYTKLTVNLFTADLEVWQPRTAVLNISNGNNTRVLVNGIPASATFTSTFPASFVFDSANNVTMTLTIAGNSYTQNVTLISDDEVTYDWILPFTSLNTPCVSILDCIDIGCSGNTYYQVDSCSTTCQYSSETCGSFCDDLVGCYDISTTDTCDRDSDCIGECLDYKTVQNELCGSDGFCKGILDTCTQYCNVTNITDSEGTTIPLPYCTENYACLFNNPTQLFRIDYIDLGFNDAYTEVEVSCNLERAGNNYCIKGYNFSYPDSIPATHTLQDFTVQPANWLVSHPDVFTFIFSDISVKCSDTCGLTYEFCANGCNTATGTCKGTTPDTGSQISSILPVWLQWILTSFFLWTMLSLVVGAVLTFIPVKISNHGQPTPELGLAGMFVMFVLGIFVGFIDPLIGLLIVIALALGLTKMLTGIFGGNG